MKKPVKIVIHDRLPEGEVKRRKRDVMVGGGYLVMVQDEDGMHASLHGQLNVARVMDVLKQAGMLEALEEAMKERKKHERA